MLASRGCRLTVVPAQTSAEDVLALNPTACSCPTVPATPSLAPTPSKPCKTDGKRQTDFRHLLGTPAHQPRHRRENPENALQPPRCEPSCARFGQRQSRHYQPNHGFAADADTLPANARITHKSLFDNTLQGIELTDKPVFCFQGHPEASPSARCRLFVRQIHWQYEGCKTSIMIFRRQQYAAAV